MVMQRVIISIGVMLLCWGAARPQGAAIAPIPTVEFCDLIRNAADYDGKQVRVRVIYYSGFEMSRVGNPTGRSCGGKTMVWAEFDGVYSQSKPEITKRLRDSFYSITVDASGNIQDQWLLWETEMLVTGTVHKPNGRGYGHTNIYSHEFIMYSVEELGAVKKTDPLKTKKS
jgi:hypothetical protein